ncbi:MAG: Rrf2 family transcriptional regulator [Sandaracinaceae bacterium]|nr:Rrf2 family transcriptional regulator [Sandaracinaceae bacterium]
MKLSSKGRYGVRAVFDIAFHSDGRATQVRDIAERQDIPARFLEQIFQDLKRAGLVSSKRGPRGGYQLAKPPDQIRMGDVIRALEGPIDLGSKDKTILASGDATSLRVTEEALGELSLQLSACFDGVSFADLCVRGETLGVQRGPKGRYVYTI